MNTSTLFKKAHALTKKIIKSGDNYRVTFGACIRFILNNLNIETVSAQEKTIDEKLEDLGLTVWEKHGKKRIYMTCEQFNTVTDSQLRLNDKNNKFFYDFATNSIMRSYKGKAPKVEVQF